MPLGIELWAHSIQRFHGADHQVAIRFQRPFHPPEQRDLVPFVEVDGHIAAEDHVESPQRREVRDQVQLLEGGHPADLVANLPAAGDGKIIPGPLGVAQAAPNLDRTEYPTAGSGHGVIGNIRAHQLNAIAAGVSQQLFEQNRDTVEFLAGGTGRAPDPDAGSASPRPAVDQLRNDLVAQQIEGRGVAEERSFIGRNGVDNPAFQLVAGIGFRQPQEPAVAAAFGFFDQAGQTALDEVRLGLVQGNGSQGVNVVRQILVFFGLEPDHALTPRTDRTIAEAIISIGATVSTTPA